MKTTVLVPVLSQYSTIVMAPRNKWSLTPYFTRGFAAADRPLTKCNVLLMKQETHQEMRYPNVTSLYFATPLAFNAPTEGFPGKISVKFCTEVKGWLRYKMAKKYCRKSQPPE